MKRNCKGNVLIYILVGVALLAALTYAISRERPNQGQSQLNNAQARLYASDLISHASAAMIAVDQITQWGVDYSDVLYDRPDQAGYTSNTNRQIYHPAGGGLQYFNTKDQLYNPNGPGNIGWVWQNQSNIEWSATSAYDIMFTFLDVHPAICAAINQSLYNDATIPTITSGNLVSVFTNSGTNPFLISDCPECEGKSSLCVYKGSNDRHIFYNIIASR